MRRRRDGPGRRIEGDELALLGIDEGEARGGAGRTAGIGRVDDDDLGLDRQRRERVGEIAEPDRLDRHVGRARELRIDRHEEIVAVRLHGPTRQIDDRDAVGPGRGRLVEEVAEGAAQTVAVEVARGRHVEARTLQRLRHEAGVVWGGRRRRARVTADADHQSDARRGGCGLGVKR